MFSIKPFEIVHLFSRETTNENQTPTIKKEEGGNFTPHNAFTGNFLHFTNQYEGRKKKGINPC